MANALTARDTVFFLEIPRGTTADTNGTPFRTTAAATRQAGDERRGGARSRRRWRGVASPSFFGERIANDVRITGGVSAGCWLLYKVCRALSLEMLCLGPTRVM